MVGSRGLWGGIALLLAAVLALPAAALATVPRSFFGVVPQAPLSARDFDRMQGVVGTVRVPFDWSQIEPRRGTYDFSGPDGIVGEAADHGVRVLPYLYGSASWLSDDPARPPYRTARARAAWARFLRQLVLRYGPGGDFWSGRPARAPIRRWQIWNEPNFLLFWHPRPSPAGYATLLRASARAIRGEDRRARIVTAGVAPVEGGMLPWRFLAKLYRVPGVRRDFDVVGLHPYSSSLRGLEYEVRQTRQVMARAGDARKPLQVTEFGTASSGLFPNPYDAGLAGQASYLRRAFRLFIAKRSRWRLTGIDWFAWQDASAVDPHCVFCEYAGLFDSEGRPKPSWRAFQGIAADPTTARLR